MLHTRSRIILLLLLLGYILLIWYQSSYFNPSSVYTYSQYIKVEFLVLIGILFELLHLIEFGILYALLVLVFLSFSIKQKRIEGWSLIIAGSYAFIDELHQYSIPFRTFSIWDLIKNIIGIVFVWMLMHYFLLKKKRT